MKPGWKTYAIGRHLVDVPADAKLIAQWKYNKDILEPVTTQDERRLFQTIAARQSELNAAQHKTQGSMFVQRIEHTQGGISLISWNQPTMTFRYRFDTWFRSNGKVIKYSGALDADRKQAVLEEFEHMAQSWRALQPDEIPTGPGFVAGDMMLVDKRFNYESWRLSIQLANKPDVRLIVATFAIAKPEHTLRERAGGILAGMLGMGLGLHRLRNRERSVGPIWAEEILVAGTQDGKRNYGFKWEAPGKAQSLAEPQINVELEVNESAYKTNAESFRTDDEALELWDTLIESIRLRPEAA